MDLTPTERDRLDVFTTAQLARAALARGLKLNAPEATAFVCDELHMAARAGRPFEEVVEVGRTALHYDQVLEGVAGIVREIRVEVLLEEGSRLVVLRDPFGAAGAGGADEPGAVRFAAGEVVLVADRERRRARVTNRSDKPVRVSSHYPFWRVNPGLEFDRAMARGFRLDLPAGDSLRWAPGETMDVDLVAYGGGGGREAGATEDVGPEEAS